jgi:hypothetical protein
VLFHISKPSLLLPLLLLQVPADLDAATFTSLLQQGCSLANKDSTQC